MVISVFFLGKTASFLFLLIFPSQCWNVVNVLDIVKPNYVMGVKDLNACLVEKHGLASYTQFEKF